MVAGPILPSSAYLGGASGNLSATVYIPGTNTNNAGQFEGYGVAASLGSNAPLVLQFNLPEAIPAGTLKLRALAMANAAAGNLAFASSDGLTSAGSSIGLTTLTSNGTTTTTWSAGDNDDLKESKVNLSSSPGTANAILTVLITFQSGATLAATSVWQFSIVWE